MRERVPALDLFATLWGMIETPASTALRIGRSEQKNYTHLLFALTGPIFFALALFAARTGDTTMPFGLLLLGIAVGGPVKWLWPVTPLGGLLLLVGWALVIASAARKNPA